MLAVVVVALLLAGVGFLLWGTTDRARAGRATASPNDPPVPTTVAGPAPTLAPSGPDEADPTLPAIPIPSIPSVDSSAIGHRARAAMCAVEKATYEISITIYSQINGRLPASLDELSEFLPPSVSEDFDLDGDHETLRPKGSGPTTPATSGKYEGITANECRTG
ncbi:MAG: hypothetical protein R2698_13880 [Microthrixaceae bacterium]